MRRLPSIPARMVLLALAIALAAGLADWALFLPDSPFDAGIDTVIAGGSATAFILPLLFST
ncbi:hypothetical protein [Methylobacterium sp. J-070]|uniref:hypothetical protein n=1 Tax=Methylobacterium sp. J-070 TaxID=2836650 RepID=UPI001FBAA119|nr:hypothetical protein [Methylobacterium sp. J-070]MCJ2050190.1 hypothetical protein [Methylobacterium sp. J-070]